MSWHIYPEGDHVEHDTENDDACICGPEARLEEGSDGDEWFYVHHSLDGREKRE